MEQIENLYIDCDGVILDTITYSYRELIEMGLMNPETLEEIPGKEKEVRHYYCTIDWQKMLETTPVINNSIEIIRQIVETKKFKKVKILTHINSIHEGLDKRRFFSKVLPGVPVIVVGKHVKKCDVEHESPRNSILVDDFAPNLIYWHQKGGIGLKFSDKKKENQYSTYIYNEKEYTFRRITSLEEVLNMEIPTMEISNNKVKKRVRVPEK